MRLGSANTFDTSLANLTSRQAELASLQEKLSTGKKVVRASDDPTGAAQAERALTRIARIETEQRSLLLQKNAIAMAESTLGDAVNVLQSVRELVVNAGNGSFGATDRASIAQQIRGLRDQLLAYANRQDTNGVPLFGGLGSTGTPFTDASGGVSFNGIGGQRSISPVAIPGVMNGHAVWMDVPTGNGVFTVEPAGGNAGALWTDAGQVTDPTLVTGHGYAVNFSVVAGVTTYDVVDTTTATTLASAQPYTSGQAIQFDGLSFKASGAPAHGDSIQLAPSAPTDLFSVLDQAVAGLETAGTAHQVAQAVTRSLMEIDAGMDRIHAARGQAGNLLNRADTIEGNQEARRVQLEADRSRAEDLDMVKGISDFQNQQTGYDAALKAYAQVQRLSLFNYLG